MDGRAGEPNFKLRRKKGDTELRFVGFHAWTDRETELAILGGTKVECISFPSTAGFLIFLLTTCVIK